MILKQLKQLTLSASRRNTHLLRLPRLYSSPAVSESLTTASKPSKRLSRDERRLVVESFVTRYRAANAGKFPTLKFTVKEVGGGYYVVRDILQELKLRPNAPISLVPNDASSLKKQDHTIESSHLSSDEVCPKGENNLVITATRDGSDTETVPLDKDVDSKCDGSIHLPESQTLKVAEECLKNSETEEEGTLDHLSSQEPRADHLQGTSVLTTATNDKRETETDPLSKDVDSKCDSDAQLPEIQTLKVADECLMDSETKDEGTLTPFVSPEPKADHLEEANCLSTETETDTPNKDLERKCDSDAQLPENQTLKVADECLKISETKDEGTLTQFVSPEPKADQLEGANVLPAPHDKRETETAPPSEDADSTCDATTHLPGSQKSEVSEEYTKNLETGEEEGTLTHLGSQEPKAEDCHEGSANVLPTETRQVPEKVDGEVKTGENSSAWSNIISFAKGFANFWRKG